jgi:hypothetical protein
MLFRFTIQIRFFQMSICRKGGWGASVAKHKKKRESAQSKRKTRYINGPLDTNINKLISRPYFILSGVNFRLPEGSFNDPDGYFIAKAPFI